MEPLASTNSGRPALAANDPVLPDEVLPLRLKTVAQLTDVSEKTVRRWIQSGLLHSHKLGGARVVRKRDLRSFLDQQAGEMTKEAP
ncbi:MAG TPA: helix-turn-helix domain-containing protein [Candidatus Didemnitutus sp.]|nr:helix-turn-helix domain-containing protein [Candidatus Didemnitutus sp.]